MMQQRKARLKAQLASCFRKLADPGFCALAASVEAASKDSELFAVAEHLLHSILPQAMEQLKAKMTEHLSKVDAVLAKQENERAHLSRSSADDLMWQLDENMQTAMDLLRRVLGDVALAQANIEFAELVPLPIARSLHSAREQSEKAQEELFANAISVVGEVLESLYSEADALLSASKRGVGAEAFTKPVRIAYRPPEFFFIDFYSSIDTYEQVRITTQGMGVFHSIRPKWFRDLLLRLPMVGGMQLGEIIGGVAGYDSLNHTKRLQLRRELSSIAAEQRRRVLSSAIDQISTSHRELKLAVVKQVRDRHFAAYEAIGKRIADLMRERRKALDFWGNTERALSGAESCAREIVALIAATGTSAA